MRTGKSILFWVAAILAMTIISNIFNLGNKRSSMSNTLAFSDFMNQVEAKNVESVSISGPDINGVMTNGARFYTYAPNDPTMFETLRKAGIRVEAKPQDNTADTFWGVFVSWFPMILLIGVWVFFMRQANAGNSKAMSFGKSRARLIENTKKVTFSDVAGCDESKQDLEEVIDFLKDPEKFQR